MTTALQINTNGTTDLITIPKENGHEVIQRVVDGWFDVVRGDEVIVYVNDEGLLIDGMEPNVLASWMTERVIFGNVLVVGCLNEKGVYDGDDHDVPQAYVTVAQMRAWEMNNNEDLRQRVIDGRNEIMEDPVQVYTQNEDGEWVRA